jgi:hypothetical protein
MSEELSESKKIGLAHAIAQGKSIPVWARQNEVPRSTAYHWARQPEVRSVVETMRRFLIDRALGQMARLTPAAIDGISKLAKGAESEAVKLRAWRALLTDQIAVSKYARWEVRLAALEENARVRSEGPNFQGGPRPVGVSP